MEVQQCYAHLLKIMQRQAEQCTAALQQVQISQEMWLKFQEEPITGHPL